MKAHRNQDKYRTENEQLKKIDMYFTLAPCGAQEMNCAQQLRDFAQDCNFELNIKVAAPYQNNKEKLSYLMTSKYCTVRAFTEKDYGKLAGYLGITDCSRQTQAMKKRDDETQIKLKQIQYSKYDHIDTIQCRYLGNYSINLPYSINAIFIILFYISFDIFL